MTTIKAEILKKHEGERAPAMYHGVTFLSYVTGIGPSFGLLSEDGRIYIYRPYNRTTYCAFVDGGCEGRQFQSEQTAAATAIKVRLIKKIRAVLKELEEGWR